MSSDYTTVGHVTVDVMTDGSARPGGSAFYSALQAARLGWRASIVTRGVRAELETLLAPYLDELELEVLDAPHTTTLQSVDAGGSRRQRVLAWAGPIGEHEPLELDTDILHLAPIARETSARWRGEVRFVGLTPQGLVRSWSGPEALFELEPLDRASLPAHCEAIVLSEAERESCGALLTTHSQRRPAGVRDAVIAVTDAGSPTELHLAGGETAALPVPAVANVCDDLGAGDVFAAAFFIELYDGRTPQEAAAFATAAAAVRVAGHGAGAIGDRAAVQARMAAVA